VDAAVVGIPSEKQMEIIKAFVQLKSTHSPSEKLSREIWIIWETLGVSKTP